MLKVLMRGVAVLTVVIATLLAAAYVSMMEERFPEGTTTSVLANLTSVEVSKTDAIAALDAGAAETAGGILLLKTDPADTRNGVLLYAFGASRTPAEIAWFAVDRHGSVLSSSELGTASLSGYYAFNSPADAAAFTRIVTDLGGSAEAAQQRPPLLSVTVFTQNPGNVIAFVATLILLGAVSFAWASSRSRAQQVRILAGVPRHRVVWQDVCEVVWTAIPPALAAWGLVSLGIWLWRGSPAAEVIFETGALALGSMMLVVLISLVCSWALLPSVSRIGTRQPAFAVVRRITDVVKFGSVAVVLICLPFAMSNALTASALAHSAASWAEVKEAVALDSNLTGDGSQDDEYMPRIDSMLRDLDRDGALALSYPIGRFLSVGVQVTQPSPAQIAAAQGGHDEVFVTNPAFLTMMGVNSAQLTAVPPSELPETTREALQGSDEIWLQPAQRSLSERVFTWHGDGIFPALGRIDGSGERATAANPLIIVVDDVSSTMKTSGFVFPALTSANLIVRDASTAQQALVTHDLSDVFPSLSTVADTTLTNAQYASRLAQLSALGIVVLLVVILLCAAQSARTWAAQHRRRLFLLHTAGRHFASIAWRRVALEVAITVALAGAVWMLAIGPTTPAAASAAMLAGAGVFVVAEIGMLLAAVRRAFHLSVARRN